MRSLLGCFLAAGLAAGSAPAQSPAAPSPVAPRPDLEQELRRDGLTAAVLAARPELEALASRASALEERATAADALPIPELKYEQWAVPLEAPWDLGRADNLMLGIAQRLPARGARPARRNLAEAEREGAVEALLQARLDLVRRAQVAFASLLETSAAEQAHREHASLLQEIVAATRARYQSGLGSQSEVLQSQLELSRLHADLASLEAELAGARTRVNRLLGRAPDAALSAPLACPPATEPLDLAGLEARLLAHQPELAQAEARLRGQEAKARLAESEARRPELEIGADYWYSPRGEERHTYAAKVMVSLPWWNRARQAEARAALAELEAERGMRDAARLDAQGELADAAAAFEAARRSYLALDQGLLDQARWGLEATRTAFATGQGGLSALLESARLKLDLEIEQIRARARLDLARAWVERVSTQPIAAENCTATGGQP